MEMWKKLLELEEVLWPNVNFMDVATTAETNSYLGINARIDLHHVIGLFIPQR